MSCRLLVACVEMRKCHLIDKINVRTSKPLKKANCGVYVGAKVKMPNIVYALFSDVDLKCAIKVDVIACLGAIPYYVKSG